MVTVRHEPTSAGEVRRALTEDLGRRGVRPDVIDDAVLLASELVGNSVRHALPLPGGVMRVGWEVSRGRIVLRVTDGGGRDAPHVRAAGPLDTRGRGLAIVDRLALDWGVDRHENGVGPVSTIWAELAT